VGKERKKRERRGKSQKKEKSDFVLVEVGRLRKEPHSRRPKLKEEEREGRKGRGGTSSRKILKRHMFLISAERRFQAERRSGKKEKGGGGKK